MSVTKYTGPSGVIQTLSDRPNDNEGLTAAELKQKFDETPDAIIDYINDNLTEEVYSKTEVDTALQNVTLGQIPDGTITQVKLATDVQNNIQGAYDAATQATKDASQNQYFNASGTVTEIATPSAGQIVLDGTNDYGTIPASVGQLTNGTSPFELIVKFKTSVNNSFFISKHDTLASTTARGWRLGLNSSGYLVLIGTTTNGVAETTMTISVNLASNSDQWARVRFDGTTITMDYSSNGTTYTGAVTSTVANLIGGLSLSDSSLTQIGRRYIGGTGYSNYFNGTIYQIDISKNSIPTNKYVFANTGTDTAILDSIGTDNGNSFGGAVQTLTANSYTRTVAYTVTTNNNLVYTNNKGLLIIPNVNGGTSNTIKIDNGAVVTLNGNLAQNTSCEIKYNGSTFDVIGSRIETIYSGNIGNLPAAVIGFPRNYKFITIRLASGFSIAASTNLNARVNNNLTTNIALTALSSSAIGVSTIYIYQQNQTNAKKYTIVNGTGTTITNSSFLSGEFVNSLTILVANGENIPSDTYIIVEGVVL